ncbi:MAG TPA: hypothetical protein VM578_07785 [Candidatus Saccharimonadales bacterium]|nr:hypothetical protein [Candidatus Saccharimonadales bacterium]
MSRTFLFAALLIAAPAYAQYGGSIYTQEIHLGSATTPTTVTVPPVEFIHGIPEEPPVSDVPPASTELLAQRHFDFGVSPTEGLDFAPQGSMYDSSFSLGEYARQFRSQKKRAITPDTTHK